MPEVNDEVQAPNIEEEKTLSDAKIADRIEALNAEHEQDKEDGVLLKEIENDLRDILDSFVGNISNPLLREQMREAIKKYLGDKEISLKDKKQSFEDLLLENVDGMQPLDEHIKAKLLALATSDQPIDLAIVYRTKDKPTSVGTAVCGAKPVIMPMIGGVINVLKRQDSIDKLEFILARMKENTGVCSCC